MQNCFCPVHFLAYGRTTCDLFHTMSQFLSFSDNMVTYNKTYKRLKKVKRDLRAGILKARKPRKADRATYFSDCYEIFDLLYDEHMAVVQHVYQCNKCKKIFYIVLNNGNYRMKRHICYVAHIANKKAIIQQAIFEKAARTVRKVRTAMGAREVGKATKATKAMEGEEARKATTRAMMTVASLLI